MSIILKIVLTAVILFLGSSAAGAMLSCYKQGKYGGAGVGIISVATFIILLAKILIFT